MRDGYYLSAYITIDSSSFLLGLRLNGHRHDQNISLWHKSGDNIRLVHYWELERLTGLKMHSTPFYDVKHAKDTINELLKQYSLCIEDIVEIWGVPELQNNNDYHSIDDFNMLSYHSVAHLFSGIFMDSDIFKNETIIGLAMDGVPDKILEPDLEKKYFYSGCVVRDGKLNLFPIESPGLLWYYAKKHFNLREGTLMALGSASTSEAYIQIEKIPEILGYSSMQKAESTITHLVTEINKITEQDTSILFNHFDPRFSLDENKISMVVKKIQELSILIVKRTISKIIKDFDIVPKNSYLSLTGGFALNCPTNSYIMDRYNFKGLLAPPCVSDTGLSLGMALYAFYKRLGCFNFKLNNAYHGDRNQLVRAGGHWVDKIIEEVSELNYDLVVNDIIEGPIVWFDGPAEIGPRSLGNRSILADPRSESSKLVLNEIKQREWWRPVAPIVIEDNLKDWFKSPSESPYMLRTFMIKEGKMSLVPSIAHLDGSARVQTIDSENNPKLYKIINKFKEITGVPILCNTSLNDKGEPIINHPLQAIEFALNKGIRVVYINNKRIKLKETFEYNYPTFTKREIAFDIFNEEVEESKISTENPYGLYKEVLQKYFGKKIVAKINLANVDFIKDYYLSAAIQTIEEEEGFFCSTEHEKHFEDLSYTNSFLSKKEYKYILYVISIPYLIDSPQYKEIKNDLTKVQDLSVFKINIDLLTGKIQNDFHQNKKVFSIIS